MTTAPSVGLRSTERLRQVGLLGRRDREGLLLKTTTPGLSTGLSTCGETRIEITHCHEPGIPTDFIHTAATSFHSLESETDGGQREKNAKHHLQTLDRPIERPYSWVPLPALRAAGEGAVDSAGGARERGAIQPWRVAGGKIEHLLKTAASAACTSKPVSECAK